MAPQGPMPMPEMHMTLLPSWLRWVWALVLLGVVVTHVWHAWGCPGQHRWWHIGHTLMAAGMIVMYVFPAMSHPDLARVGLVLYATLTAALAVTAGWWWRRERQFNPLWAASTLDMLNRSAALDWLFVAYLGLQTLAWALGAWNWRPLYRSHRVGTPRPGSSGTVSTATSIDSDTLAAPRPQRRIRQQRGSDSARAPTSMCASRSR